MASKQKGWIVRAILLIWAVAATVGAAYYYNQYTIYSGMYEDVSKKLASTEISVNLLVKYDDGSKEWYNTTSVQIGVSVFDLTLQVAKVEYKTSSFGAYVTSINGAGEKADKNIFWIWWIWDESQGAWTTGPIAPDQYKLRDESVVAWYLVDTSSWPPTPP